MVAVVENIKEKIIDKKNIHYYNKIVEKDVEPKKAKKVKSTSFTSQSIHLEDYLVVPEGLEYFAYLFYFIAIPYATGAIFLFFVVASANIDNFLLLNTSAFFIVWAIGYEIVAVFLLIYISYLFLKYDSEEY